MVACNENLTSPGYAQIRLICAGFTEVLGDTGPRTVGDLYLRVPAASRDGGSERRGIKPVADGGVDWFVD